MLYVYIFVCCMSCNGTRHTYFFGMRYSQSCDQYDTSVVILHNLFDKILDVTCLYVLYGNSV